MTETEYACPEGWEVLFSQAEISRAVERLVTELLKLEGILSTPVMIIEVLESARVFAADLQAGLEAAGAVVSLESIWASSYSGRPGEQSEVRITGIEELTLDPEKITLVVDDMVDSGATMKAITERLNQLAELSAVFPVVLINKLPEIDLEYFHALIDSNGRWVAGYGINGNDPKALGRDDGRSLPFIVARLTIDS